jgi:archaemetzincin
MVSSQPAITTTEPLSAVFQADREFFTPLHPPEPGDWLAEHWETGQTFEQFVGTSPISPDNIRNIIYLQPLEQFIADQSPPLTLLLDYAEAYFSLPAQLLHVLTEDEAFTTRVNPYTATQQMLTTDILGNLKHYLPVDAFCVLAVTMQDLYPDPEWNFVFGQASQEDRVAVFSFARYDPAFYGIPRDEGYRTILLRRCCKVVIHEIGHLFGLPHCLFYSCSMNGSNHIQESDARPMHLCPECLRKLHHIIGFDVIDRYFDLFQFYRQVGFPEEARWVQRRLESLTKR